MLRMLKAQYGIMVNYILLVTQMSMTPLIESQKLNRFYCHSYGKGLSGGRIEAEEESPFLSPSGGLCPETEY